MNLLLNIQRQHLDSLRADLDEHIEKAIADPCPINISLVVNQIRDTAEAQRRLFKLECQSMGAGQLGGLVAA